MSGLFRSKVLPSVPEIFKPTPISPKPVEVPKSTGKLYPDFATVMSERMKTRGQYAKGWPLGAIVHFTSGRDGAENTIKDGIKNGYAYWCIQKDGRLFCAHHANEWGYHAGESKWKTLLGAVSDDLIGIEINNGSKLTKTKDGRYKTWFGTYIPEENVRYTEGKDNQEKGYYEKYTPAQEETLIKTLMWLKAQNPSVFSFDNCLGHDEVAGPMGLGYWRKNDPGAALSVTMPEFRKLLEEKYKLGWK